jgi:hypothetical protein
MRDIVFDDVFDKQSSQSNTYHWGNQIPPMVLLNQMMLHQVVNAVYHQFEQLSRTRGQRTDKETQYQYQVFLWNVLLTPGNKSIVCTLFSKH